MMRDEVYDEAKKWLEEKYSEAHNRDDKNEMLLIEWIIDTMYFDNDMRTS
jgi:hypothetical protein